MDKFDKNMSEIFDLEVIEEVKSNTSTELVKVEERESSFSNEDLIEDYEKVRKNYEEIVDKGKGAIDEILAIAKDSQHPRAYEVASTLINTIVSANEKMIALQKQMREMDKPAETGSSTTKIDKAVFIGSPADLNKMLKGTFNDGNDK